MKLVLDTNAYCDYAEGLPYTVDFIATRSEDIFVPSIVLVELTYGFMKGHQQHLNRGVGFQSIRRPDLKIAHQLCFCL